MDNAFLVGGGEAPSDLLRVVQRLAHRQRIVVQLRAQLFAVEKLGDDVGRASVIADVVNREYVRMVERRGRSRLLLETAQPICVCGEIGRQDFERDLAAQPLGAGAIDFAHPARA